MSGIFIIEEEPQSIGSLEKKTQKKNETVSTLKVLRPRRTSSKVLKRLHSPLPENAQLTQSYHHFPQQSDTSQTVANRGSNDDLQTRTGTKSTKKIPLDKTEALAIQKFSQIARVYHILSENNHSAILNHKYKFPKLAKPNFEKNEFLHNDSSYRMSSLAEVSCRGEKSRELDKSFLSPYAKPFDPLLISSRVKRRFTFNPSQDVLQTKGLLSVKIPENTRSKNISHLRQRGDPSLSKLNDSSSIMERKELRDKVNKETRKILTDLKRKLSPKEKPDTLNVGESKDVSSIPLSKQINVNRLTPARSSTIKILPKKRRPIEINEAKESQSVRLTQAIPEESQTEQNDPNILNHTTINSKREKTERTEKKDHFKIRTLQKRFESFFQPSNQSFFLPSDKQKDKKEDNLPENNSQKALSRSNSRISKKNSFNSQDDSFNQSFFDKLNLDLNAKDEVELFGFSEKSKVPSSKPKLSATQRYENLMKTNIEERFQELIRSINTKKNLKPQERTSPKRVRFSGEEA